MERFIRFEMAGNDMYGRLNEERIEVLDGPYWLDVRPTGETVGPDEIKPLCPVQPSKIILVGLNYRTHVTQSQSATKVPDYPVIFLKPPTALIGHRDNIVYPDSVDRVDYEAELGFIIGKEAKNVAREDAEDYVFGYTCVNDVTARKLQKQDGQWTRAKGFDTFCPAGPYAVRGIDSSDLLVEAYLNGERKQHGRTSDLIFPIPFLVEFISSVMTLLPGDLISTGTPQGIDPMQRGDTIEVRIEKIGSLINKII